MHWAKGRKFSLLSVERAIGHLESMEKKANMNEKPDSFLN